MKTRDELEKMNKCALIEYILNNEVLPVVRDNGNTNGLNLAQVCYVEQVGKSIADKRTCFHPIIHSRIDPETDDLIITVPSMSKAAADRRVKAKALRMEINRAETEAYEIKACNDELKAKMGR